MPVAAGSQGKADYCILNGVVNYSLDGGNTWTPSGGGEITLASDPRTGGGQAANAGVIGLLAGSSGLSAFVKDNTSNVNGWFVFPGTAIRSSVTGSNVTTVTFTVNELDGDQEITGNILLPINITPVLTLNPNSVGANMQGQTINMQLNTFGGGNLATGGATGNLIDTFATGATTGSYVWFRARMSILHGFNRVCDVSALSFVGGTASRIVNSRTMWSDTTTVVTSIVLTSSVASSILIGSNFVQRALGVSTSV
jgi:hypothetical protein